MLNLQTNKRKLFLEETIGFNNDRFIVLKENIGWEINRSSTHPLIIQNKISNKGKTLYLLCTRRIKCWGGTKARSISTSATTIFLASFLKPSRAALAIATTWLLVRNKGIIELDKMLLNKAPSKNVTSRLKGGYLPSPGVAFAEAETMSTRTRWT